MRIAVAAYHLPHPQGSAAGRQLWALGETARAAGHDLTVWCWGEPPAGLPAPEWCRVEPHPAPARTPIGLLRTARSPREHLRGAWQPPADAAVLADGRDSMAAVPDGRPAVLVVHHSVRLDVAATGDWRAGAVQDWRAERRAVARATVAAALSDRVRRTVGAAALLPATVAAPARPLPPVEAPVALLLADYRWAPNLAALHRLLRLWPRIRAAVPTARLLLAGRGSERLGDALGIGVSALGPVDDAAAVMAQAALLVFPCPPSSGPKLKVLDAVLHGLAVVTTRPGVEGLRCPGVAVADDDGGFVAAAVTLLGDADRRAAAAASARVAALEAHAPQRVLPAWLGLARSAEPGR